MNQNKIIELLNKYNIDNLSQLEDILIMGSEDCIDLHEEDMKNVCLEKKCFNHTIPLCRRLVEVYNKLYKEKFPSKKEFALYLEEKTGLKKSSIENWLSCKQCKYNVNDKIVGNVKTDFLLAFCKELDLKLDYQLIFKDDYKSIEVFKKVIEPLTKDNFEPLSKKQKKSNKMTKEEQDRLYDITLVSKKQLEKNLKLEQNLIGSDEYKFNLALEAFERRLDSESLKIVKLLEKSSEYKNDANYYQLKAKLLSNEKKDEEAIVILQKLIELQKPNIDVETHNLLAASIKRAAFKEFDLYTREEVLKKELKKSLDIYKKIYEINKHYYPAINSVYLEMILSYIEPLNNEEMAMKIEDMKRFWDEVELDEEDYWSYISNIEFLILTKEYEKAKEKFDKMLEDLESEELKEFKSFSTNRQLEFYTYFNNEKELRNTIEYMKNRL